MYVPSKRAKVRICENTSIISLKTSKHNKISRVSILCKQLDLSLNPSQTQEMLCCTKREKPDSTTLQLDGLEIELCDNDK